MDSGSIKGEISIDFSPYFRVHKDGRFERMVVTNFPHYAPPSDSPDSDVRSKDVVISPETGVSVRIYLPRISDHRTGKLPLLVYIHGGAFCLGSATNPPFDNFVISVLSRTKCVVVSVDYRLAPENPLPIAFDDSWSAFNWVASHAGGEGPEPWLNEHVDFQRVFLGGESAGANLAHDVAIRSGAGKPDGPKIVGLLLIHPFFGGKEVDKLYKYLCPASSGRDDDPRLNPAVDPRLPAMGCRRVLFCLAEKDFLRDRGRAYYEALRRSEWRGTAEIMETEGEGHAFHLFNPACEKALALVDRVVSFLKA